MSISLKVTLKDVGNDVTEVRRFAIDLDESQPSLKALQQKLVNLFPEQLICKDYRIKWKDSDSDWVTVLSDDELSVALKEMAGTSRSFLFEIFDQNSTKLKFSGKRKESHVGVTCKGCGNKSIVGFRYKCIICPNYDLCSNCEAGGHHLSHYMMRIATPEDAWPPNTFWRLEPVKEPACGCGLCTFQQWNLAKAHGWKTAQHPDPGNSECSSCKPHAQFNEPLQSETIPDVAADISKQHTDNEDSCSDSTAGQPESVEIFDEQVEPDTACNQQEPDVKTVEIPAQGEPEIQIQEDPDPPEPTDIAEQESDDHTGMVHLDPVAAPDLCSELQVSKDNITFLDTQVSVDNYYANPEIQKSTCNDSPYLGIQQCTDGNLDVQHLTDKEAKSLFRPHSSSSSSSSSTVDIPFVTILEQEDDLESTMPAGFEASSLKQVLSVHSLNNINEPFDKDQHGDPYQSDAGIPSLGQPISTFVSVYNLNEEEQMTTGEDSGAKKTSKRYSSDKTWEFITTPISGEYPIDWTQESATGGMNRIDSSIYPALPPQDTTHYVKLRSQKDPDASGKLSSKSAKEKQARRTTLPGHDQASADPSADQRSTKTKASRRLTLHDRPHSDQAACGTSTNLGKDKRASHSVGSFEAETFPEKMTSHDEKTSQEPHLNHSDGETSALEDQVFDVRQRSTKSRASDKPQPQIRTQSERGSNPVEKMFYDDRKTTMGRRRLKLEQKAEKKIQKLEMKIEREKRKVGWEEPQAPEASLPIPDPKIQKSLVTMLDMGFSNENGTLLLLLESKEGDIGKVIDILQRSGAANQGRTNTVIVQPN